MAVLQFSETLRNNRLNQFEVTLAASPKLRIYSGAIPANCAAAVTGTLLCEMLLPADFMADAAGGSKAKAGTWNGAGTAAAAGGTNAGYFRIVDAAGTTTHCQGDVSAPGGGGAMVLDNVSVADGQVVAVISFVLTESNA